MISNCDTSSSCDIRYKIVFLGEMNVGKSSIIQRFINNTFYENREHTVGIDFMGKNIPYKQHLYRLQLWDTAGQQRFRSLIPAYLRDAHCAVIVFDLTSRQSFKMIQSWVDVFNEERKQDAIMLLVGNKLDLNSQIKISEQQIFQLATKLHAGFCKVSAKNGEGITNLFESIVENIQIQQSSEALQKLMTENQINEEANATERRINKQKVIKVSKKAKFSFSCCSI